MTEMQQGFPQIQMPFVRPDGRIEQAWLQLLITMWNRTGGGPGNDPDLINLGIGSNSQSLLMELEARVDALESQNRALLAQVDDMRAALLALPAQIAADVAIAQPRPEFTMRSGTWTPTLSAATTAPTGATFDNQFGWWSQVGDILLVSGQVRVTDIGAGGVGNIQMLGLPIAAANTGESYGVVYSDGIDWSAGYTSLLCYLAAGSSTITFYQLGDNVVISTMTWNLLSNNDTIGVCIFAQVR